MKGTPQEKQDATKQVLSSQNEQFKIKKQENEEFESTAEVTASVPKQGKRIKTEKEKAKDAEAKRILRAKIKANDPTVPKKTVESMKKRNKKRTEQFNAILNDDRTKDKELEHLRQRIKELEDKLTKSEKTVKKQEVEISELKEKTEDIETLLRLHSTVSLKFLPYDLREDLCQRQYDLFKQLST